MGSFPCWRGKASSEEEVENTRNRREQLDQSSGGGRGIWDPELRAEIDLKGEENASSKEAAVAKIRSVSSYSSHLINSTSLWHSKYGPLLRVIEPWDRAIEFPEKSKMSVVENRKRTKLLIHKRQYRCHSGPDRGWKQELIVASTHVAAWFPPAGSVV